eukprot:ANDGO_00984.mRNA.1 E3 ubiquitin-protein ligase hel2
MEDLTHCSVCCEEMSIVSVGPCNHHSVCYKCSLRLRILSRDTKCCICKADLPVVVLSADKSALFASYKLPSLIHERSFNVYCNSREIFDLVKELKSTACPECHEKQEGVQGLKHHVKAVHHKQYCELCARSSKKFICELPLFNDRELNHHKNRGDESVQTSFKGHPQCKFCREYFYSEDELFEHMNRKHEQCFLCQRQNVHFLYFRGFPELEKHFNEDHFPCPVKSCQDDKFSVFASEADLRTHMAVVHDEGRVGNKLDLGFIVSSSDSADDSQRRRERRTNRNSHDVVDLTSVANLNMPMRSREDIHRSMMSRQPPVAGDRFTPQDASARNFESQSRDAVAPSSKSHKKRSTATASSNSAGPHSATSDADGSSSLSQKIRSALDNDEAKFKRFQAFAADYRRGVRNALTFLKAVQESFDGRISFEILRDLADSCPNEQQRGDLKFVIEEEREKELKGREREQRAREGIAVLRLADHPPLAPSVVATNSSTGSSVAQQSTSGPWGNTVRSGATSSNIDAWPTLAGKNSNSEAGKSPSPWVSQVVGKSTAPSSSAADPQGSYPVFHSASDFPSLAVAPSSSTNSSPHDRNSFQQKDNGKSKTGKWNMYVPGRPASRPVQNAWAQGSSSIKDQQ